MRILETLQADGRLSNIELAEKVSLSASPCLRRVRALEEEGIIFIGPKHASIAAMGDKIASKKLAGAAGVSCIPGYNAAIDTPAQAVEISRFATP